MIAVIQPSSLSGTIQAPASKSSMQRACAAALVSKGESRIKNPGHSNDDKAAMDIVKRLGAELFVTDNELIIKSRGVHPVDAEINCGESGLSIRMFTPLAALSEKRITIRGSGSLATRPMDFFDAVLPKLRVKIETNNGRLPLVIQGPVIPANITVDGSLSSQFLTGLLMAYAAANASDVAITVDNLKSRPYIDLTLDVMKQFGLKMPANRNYESFYFNSALVSKGDGPVTHSYTVEGDWSGGAFLLVAGAIAGNIIVKGLDVSSTQADKAVLQALMDAGAGISIQPSQIELRPLPLKAFHFNATDCPDLFPPLVALAACCNGTTTLEGASRLTHKESNRALTLQEEFGKMGVVITLQGDLMLVKGGTGITGARVHSRYDHRIAMACAVAGLKAGSETVIEEADAIDKSYPDFYGHLQKLGASLQYTGTASVHQ
ncbi:MAG: 3-phosphoshikimate 1-carboxyvinyltransferase [Bacteroidota bacterium]